MSFFSNKRKVWIWAVIFFIVLAGLISFQKKGQNESVLLSLKEDVSANEFVRLSSILGVKQGVVCLMLPYEPFVVFKDKSLEKRINKYLQENKIVVGEGEWLLFYYSEGEKNIWTFSRNKYPRGMARLKIRENKNIFPTNFEPTNCSKVDSAVVFMTQSNELVLGVSQ